MELLARQPAEHLDFETRKPWRNREGGVHVQWNSPVPYAWQVPQSRTKGWFGSALITTEPEMVGCTEWQKEVDYHLDKRESSAVSGPGQGGDDQKGEWYWCSHCCVWESVTLYTAGVPMFVCECVIIAYPYCVSGGDSLWGSIFLCDTYRSLSKEHPWANHFTSLPKRGWALFRLFPHLTTKEHPHHVYRDSKQ